MLLIFATAKFASAGVHPVPLDKDVKSETCVQCHEDKAKGKAVHSAIAMGCLSCHEVRVSKEVTRVKLTTTTPVSLCITCHADKKAADLKGQVHSPAVRDCIKCHDPHSSPNKNQLLKATSGVTKDENLCLSCHKVGVDVPKDGSRHAALDTGCDTCHTTHKTGDRTQREFAYHLTKSTPQLCFDCHDVKDPALAKAHQNQPFEKADCLTCHDPHQSSAPKLMQAFRHNPFESKTCEACHAAAKDGKVVLTQADSKTLCVSCHADKPEQIEKAKVQHPGAQGDCIECHNPHAGKSQGFLKPDAVTACLNCHTDEAEQGKKAHLHQPAFQQGCATCHEPHGSDNAHLLRAKDTASVCMECHGPTAGGQKLEAEHRVAIFGGKVKLQENYFDKVVRLPIKYGLGHPVDGHPVQPQFDPTDKNKVRVQIDCLTCHQPHSSAQPDMLVKDQVNNMAFCDTCHKDRTMRTTGAQ
jgi:predicted CXXCH cytochrome family protein